MFRRMPALGALRAFEAAARLSSFKAAAAELSVTPGAVSQQVRRLEEDLGTKLFLRATRSVTLTEAGRQLQPKLTAAFLQIRDAVDSVAETAIEPLQVSASAPLISKWLLPRLHRFSERTPDLNVSIQSSDALRAPEGQEVFIRFNEWEGPDVYAEKLCDEYLLPLASPDLIARLDLRKPADLARAPLLHHTATRPAGPTPGWADWFRIVGLDPAGATRGMQFDPSSAGHAIDAAVNGAGVVLGRRFLAHGDVLEGRIVSPFGPAIRMNVAYYVVCRPGAETVPDVAAFIDWVRAEVAAMDRGLMPGTIAVEAPPKST